MLYGPDERPLPPSAPDLRDPIFDPRVQDRGFSPNDARAPTPEYMDEARRAVESALERLDAKGISGVTFDAFVNELTGLGNPAIDKTMGGSASGPAFRLVRRYFQESSDRARGSDLGRNIVDKIPDEMTREGWDIAVQPTDHDTAVAQEPAALLDAARREPRRAAAWWRLDAKRRDGRQDRAGAERARVNARRWDFVAQGMAPPEAPAPPPPRGPLPRLNDEGIELSEAIEKWSDAIDVVNSVNQALRYERCFGGGAVFIGVDDGESDLTRPLDPTKIKSITHLTPLTGGWDGEAVMWRPYNDPRQPKHGQPEIYQVRNQYVQLARPPAPGETRPVQQILPSGPTGPTIWYVHASRMLVFDGEPVSRAAQQEMRGWGDSIFTRVNDPLAQYEQTWNAVAILMQEFSISTLAIEGLTRALGEQGAAGARRDFLQYAAFQALTQSVARMRFIDSREKMERSTASVAGVAEILREYSLRLAAASDMPVSLLFGQVKGGLGDAGNTDLRWFYDRVASKQKRRLLPQLMYLYRLGWMAKNSPTRGVEPERWALTFRALWQLSKMEEADLRAKTVTADSQEIISQVVTPEEVAATRYGGAEYNTGPIVLDRDGRFEQSEVSSESATEEAQQAAANPLGTPGARATPAPAGNGAASVPVPPMRAMASSPITGDPQDTPSNIGTDRDISAPSASKERVKDVPARRPTQAAAGSPASPARAAPAASAPTLAPALVAPAAAAAAPIDLTATAQGAIVKVNEARASLGLPKLTTANGELDPDGELTIAQYTAKHEETIAASVNAEEGTPPAAPATPARKDAAQLHLDAGSGVMVAVWIPPDLAQVIAVPEGEAPEELHITLAYLGKPDGFTSAQLAALHAQVQALALSSKLLAGVLGGVGRFSASGTSGGLDVVHALVDVPGLSALRERLVMALDAAGLHVKNAHGFSPHVTLALVDPADPSPIHRLAPQPLAVSSLVVSVGEERTTFPFDGAPAQRADDEQKREPAGSPDGGQFAPAGGGSSGGGAREKPMAKRTKLTPEQRAKRAQARETKQAARVEAKKQRTEKRAAAQQSRVEAKAAREKAREARREARQAKTAARAERRKAIAERRARREAAQAARAEKREAKASAARRLGAPRLTSGKIDAKRVPGAGSGYRVLTTEDPEAGYKGRSFKPASLKDQITEFLGAGRNNRIVESEVGGTLRHSGGARDKSQWDAVRLKYDAPHVETFEQAFNLLAGKAGRGGKRDWRKFDVETLRECRGFERAEAPAWLHEAEADRKVRDEMSAYYGDHDGDHDGNESDEHGGDFVDTPSRSAYSHKRSEYVEGVPF